MNSMIKVAAAILVLALAAGGAVAQGAGERAVEAVAGRGRINCIAGHGRHDEGAVRRVGETAFGAALGGSVHGAGDRWFQPVGARSQRRVPMHRNGSLPVPW